jgi:very-short-patch-repair endonuclease
VAAGELHPKYPGVYAFGRPDLAPNGNRIAAVLACGPRAVLSHASAASHWGIRRSASAYFDITIPAGRPLRRHKGIRCHRAVLTSEDVTQVDGIPVTSISRTLLDLSTHVGDASVEKAANEAEILGLFDRRAMEDLLGRSKGHRGIRRLRRVLQNGDLSGENVPKSGLERRYAELCAQRGLPKPGINRWILLGDEYHEVDFLWRAEKVVIEVDSNRYHQTGWKLRRDTHRDNLLTAHGYLHDRVPEDLLLQNPFEATEKAAALLQKRLPQH